MILKTKKLLTLFLTSIIFLINGCTVEKESIEISKNHDYKLEQKSFKEVMNHPAFNNAFNRIPRKKAKANDRSDLEDQLGFTIIEQAPVTVIQNDGKTSYTLLIVSDNNIDNKLENLILNADPESEELGYIVKYNAEIGNVLNANQIVQAGTASIEPLLDNTASRCDTVINVTYYCTNEAYYCGGTDTANGCKTTYTVTKSCSGLDPEYSGGSSPTGGGGVAGDSGSSSGGSGTYTSPTTITYTSINLEQVLSLDTEQANWVNDPENSKIVQDLQIYIFNNIGLLHDQNSIYSMQMTEYVKQVINDIINRPTNYIPSNVTLIRPNILNKISNINDYLKCFDLTQGAVFTIYVDQPTPNSNEAWSLNPLDPSSPNVGHTFIAIKQGTIRRVLGFYPKNGVDLEHPQTQGVLHNNSSHEYDASLSLPISSTQLNNIINYIKVKSATTYNLNSYNCTDFGMSASNLAGLPIPSAYGTWGNSAIGKGSGDNPGQLGQNIRNYPTSSLMVKTTLTGVAPSNIGSCP